MPVELTEILWLDGRQQLSLKQLAELSGLPEAELRELVEFGVIAPVDPGASQPLFYAECVITARAARRLRRDFELDVSGLALVVSLLDRIRELETRLHYLSAQLPRRH